jgi:hypothetical protein
LVAIVPREPQSDENGEKAAHPVSELSLPSQVSLYLIKLILKLLIPQRQIDLFQKDDCSLMPR